ncbi:MAG: FapA family protein [Gemmatimonadota bacterium]|nr:FapA family protein [Gemmatimonadota bacterium]
MAEELKNIEVSIKKDGLEAYITVPFMGSGGSVESIMTSDEARAALKDEGVVFGVLEDELQRIFGESVFDEEVLVARGKEPVEGTNAKIERFFKDNKEFQPAEDNEGRIDFRDVSFLVNVAKGDKLCVRHPSSEGVDGKTVKGETVKATPGMDIKLPQGTGTEPSPEDANVLISTVDGCVEVTGSGIIEVAPNLEIKGDVDFSTGNINFSGSLVIKGDVKSGFKVECAGNVEIGGCVEDAEIEAGGDVLIKNGFTGRGKGIIRTKGDLAVKYIQGQQVECDGSLIVGGELVHAKANVGGDVMASSRKGAIIGGELEVRGSVEATQIGNVSYTHTQIHAGSDFRLEKRMQEINEELEKIEENEKNVKKALYNLSHLKMKLNGELPPEQKEMFNRLQETISYYPKHCSELKQELGQIKEDISKDKQATVKIHKTLFPGTKITIGKFSRTFDETVQHQTLCEVKGQIVSSV